MLGDRVMLVDLLAVMFGISSWISINGLWVELPILVQHLPEGWALPSYLSIIVQLANVGPILYGVLRSCLPRPPSQPLTISFLLLVGVGSSLALALAWSHTALLGSNQHSLGLFVSVFLLSLVDCTSSVLFLPYMGLFKRMYLIPYMIGEGMSGFLPSLAALIQGVSGNLVCVNVTLDNGTEVEQAVADDPRFSTSGFFSFLVGMMFMSLAAFLLLEHLPLARKERLSGNSSSFNTNLSEAVTGEEEDKPLLERGEGVVLERYNLATLLAVQCFVCFLSNGALPSIQSYSCLPYGNTVYHLAVTLNATTKPLMAFLAFFLPCTRQKVVVCLTLTGGLLSGFILATALASPHMVGGSLGGSLVVGAWVVSGAILSYVKVSVAGMCREVGWLFQCGAVTQAGSAVGALIMFILVNQVELFSGYHVTCRS